MGLRVGIVDKESAWATEHERLHEPDETVCFKDYSLFQVVIVFYKLFPLCVFIEALLIFGSLYFLSVCSL